MVNGVAGVIVMMGDVLTVADGLGSGVAVGTGLDQGVEEEPLIEHGADSLAVDHLTPGPHLSTHSKPIQPRAMDVTWGGVKLKAR